MHGQARAEGQGAESDGDVNDGQDSETEDRKPTADERKADDVVCPLIPWAKSEVLVRELINMYKPSHVVSFCTGEGEEMLACVREKVPYLGIVASKRHTDIVKQHVRLVIALEQLDGIADGFADVRVLSRTRSVGGEDHEPEETGAAAKDSKAIVSIDAAATGIDSDDMVDALMADLTGAEE